MVSMPRSNPAAAFAGGAAIGTLGGLIGLGGAEFRLPLLIGVFRLAALEAVILNKAMSLIVVASALVFRTRAVPFVEVAAHGATVLNLLAGSLIGAWWGAGWATRLGAGLLYKVIAVMLVAIAAVLLLAHDVTAGSPALSGAALVVAGLLAGPQRLGCDHPPDAGIGRRGGNAILTAPVAAGDGRPQGRASGLGEGRVGAAEPAIVAARRLPEVAAIGAHLGHAGAPAG